MLIDPPWWAQLPPTQYDRVELPPAPTGYTGRFGELPPAPTTDPGLTYKPYRIERLRIEGPRLPVVDLAGDLFRRITRAIAADDHRREAALLAELTRRRR